MINYKKTKCLLGVMALPSLLLASENGNNTLLAVDKIDVCMRFMDSYSTSAKAFDGDEDNDVQYSDRVQYLIEAIDGAHTGRFFKLPDDLFWKITLDFLGSVKDFESFYNTCKHCRKKINMGIVNRYHTVFASGKSIEDLVGLGHFCGKNPALLKELLLKKPKIITNYQFSRGVNEILERQMEPLHKIVFEGSLRISIWDFYCINNYYTSHWLYSFHYSSYKLEDIKTNPYLFFHHYSPILDNVFFRDQEEKYDEVETQSMMQQYCSMMVKLPIPSFMVSNHISGLLLPLYNTEEVLLPFIKALLVSPEKKRLLGGLIALYKRNRIFKVPSDGDDTNSQREVM